MDNDRACNARISGVAVNMSPCHGEDRGFDSRLIRQYRPDSSVGRARD